MSTADDFALKAYIQKTAGHLIDSMEAARSDEFDDGPYSYMMVTDVIQLIMHLAQVDRDFSLDEVELLANIIDWIDPDYREENLSSWTSPEQLRWIFLKLNREAPKWSGGASIDVLVRIDDMTGSVLAEEAKAMFFRIANAIVKVDGSVSQSELEAIAELKESLYQSREPTYSTMHEVDKVPSTVTQVIKRAKERDLDQLMLELESYVGLTMVKYDVKKLADFLEDQQVRKRKGQPTLPIPKDLVFFGNRGTGKTMVARLIAEIYGAVGVINQGHLVEAERSNLVAGFVGETAEMMRGVIESAVGGVLIIDEAHSLVRLGQDYEYEAIQALVKLIDYYRRDLVVILAGSPEKMKSFIGSNPELRSQFRTYFYFEDYAPKELLEIFNVFCKKAGYKLSKQAFEQLLQVFDTLYRGRDDDFSNAHLAKSVFEKAVENQAYRLIGLSDVSEQQLSAIYATDIPAAAEFQWQ